MNCCFIDLSKMRQKIEDEIRTQLTANNQMLDNNEENWKQKVNRCFISCSVLNLSVPAIVVNSVGCLVLQLKLICSDLCLHFVYIHLLCCSAL